MMGRRGMDGFSGEFGLQGWEKYDQEGLYLQISKESESLRQLRGKFHQLQQDLTIFAQNHGGSFWKARNKNIAQSEKQPFLDRIQALKEELKNYFLVAPGSEVNDIMDWLVYMQVTMHRQLGLKKENYTRGLSRLRRQELRKKAKESQRNKKKV